MKKKQELVSKKKTKEYSLKFQIKQLKLKDYLLKKIYILRVFYMELIYKQGNLLSIKRQRDYNGKLDKNEIEI